MGYIDDLSKAILILIRVGIVFRVGYSFLGMVINEDEAQAGKKRIKNAIKYYVMAELVFIIKETILYYYR